MSGRFNPDPIHSPLATPTHAGDMSASDKAKLDGIGTGNLAMLLNPARFRVYATAAQAIPTSTVTVANFDAARWNTVGAIAGSATFSGNRWTVSPPGVGVYEIGCHVRWAPSAAGSRRVAALRFNGNTIIATDDQGGGFSATAAQSHNLVTRWNFGAGDYVEVVVFQDTGVALNTFPEVADSVEFWGSWVHSLENYTGTTGGSAASANTGPAGPQGATGPSGATGATGATGPAGVVGPLDPTNAGGDLVYRNPRSVATVAVGFMGDSITFGYGTTTPAPTFVAADLTSSQVAVTTVNQGHSGAKVRDFLPGAGSGYWSAAIAAFGAAGVRLVHLMFGPNDVGAGYSAATITADYVQLFAALVGAGYIPVVSDSINGTDSTLATVAANLAILRNNVTILKGDTLAKGYFTANPGSWDGTHPNDTGTPVMAQYWANALQPYVLMLAGPLALDRLPLGPAGQAVVSTGTTIAYGTPTLADSGVAAGTYSNPTVTVDSKGRITAASAGAAMANPAATIALLQRQVDSLLARVAFYDRAAVIASSQYSTVTTGGGANQVVDGDGNLVASS